MGDKKRAFKNDQEEELKQAFRDSKHILYLQRCYACSTHQMHTKHSEAKYESMSKEFKAYVKTNLGADYTVFENILDDCYWKLGCFDVWTKKNKKKKGLLKKKKKKKKKK